MAVTEHGRIVLYRHFEEDMGEEKARTLMDHLLPVGWTNLATNEELRATERSLRHEIQTVEQSLRHEIQALGLATQHEFKAVRQELAQVKEAMATKVELLELKAEMYKGFKSITLALMGLMVTLQAITIATVRLI